MTGRVLTVAESDASGAAGIQGDVKTILALGGYATTAISALYGQCTKCPRDMVLVPPDFVAAQMRHVLDGIGTGAFKIGYLDSEAMVNAVADVLDAYRGKRLPVVVDPSIVERDGTVLVDDAAVAAWKRRLYVRATALTPNVREAEILTGMTIRDIDDMKHAADMMRTLGAENIVLKAGQAASGKMVYLVATDSGEIVFERPRLETGHTLGAGATLSAAIAVSLAQGMDIHAAVNRALDYMHQAILHAPGYGGAQGPMNHAFEIEKHGTFFRPQDIKVHRA